MEDQQLAISKVKKIIYIKGVRSPFPKSFAPIGIFNATDTVYINL